MAQTSYTRSFPGQYSGQLADSGNKRIESFQNGNAAAMPAGIAVARKSSDPANQMDLLAAATDSVLGVTVLDYARSPDYPSTLTGSDAIQSGGSANVLTEGAIFVQVEQDVATTDQVFTRVTSDGGSNTQCGRFRKDADSGRAVLLHGARWLTAGTSGGNAQVMIDMAASTARAFSFPMKNASVSATTLSIEFTNRDDRSFVIDQVDYYNATGLAADASNYFDVQVRNGSTVAANWSTLNSAQGALAAATVTKLVNSTAANRTVAPSGTVQLNLAKTGTQTLPAGTFTVHGHFA